MSKIPKELLAEILTDPFYEKCCITGKSKYECKIEFHHNLIFGGKQVQKKYAILPLSVDIHKQANNKDIKERLDLIMLNRMTEQEIKEISKAINWFQRFKYLKEKYETYTKRN